MEQTIACPKGCAPRQLELGTTPKTLRWTYSPAGDGSVFDVSGLPDPPFSNPRSDGPDFLIDYGGNPGGDLTWRYAVRSSPTCPNKAQPQLGTGPG